MKITIPRRWILAGAAGALLLVGAYVGFRSRLVFASPATVSTPGHLSPVDILVFSPHPDDDVLGCAGVIQQAVADGKQVRVVFSTLGDAYTEAASAMLRKEPNSLTETDYFELAKSRQQEAITAEGLLGVPPENLVFLGYPDGVLARVATAKSNAMVTSLFTHRSSTYGPVVTDYHSWAHDRAAPYYRDSVLGDFVEVLQQSAPERVYVADGADAHPDHAATFDLVKAAMAQTGYQGEFRTFLVHSHGSADEWPWPHAATPTRRYEQHTAGGKSFPADVPWPPDERVALTPEQAELKRQAIMAHASQWNLPENKIPLGAFVKADEIFWSNR
ncbi:PIG-L family deacetylase [Pendulispora rubella]|uniref:PIG-L family deacetylase n=1 Tax=Pendulispora rubella TaxID=2741070 RepID=A0ABZ2KUA9_9BACT